LELAASLDAWSNVGGTVLGTLARDSTGSAGADIVSDILDPEALNELEPVIIGHMRDLPVGDTAYVVLLDRSESTPRRVAKWSECPPAVLNSRSIAQDLVDRVGALPISGVQRLEVALKVGPDGRILERRIERSSGYLQLDQAMFDALGIAQVRPGNIAGIPLLVWLHFPVTVELSPGHADAGRQ